MCSMNNQTLPLPNPGDWMTLDGAAFLLTVSTATVRRMVRDGVLTEYRPLTRLGMRGPLMLWRPEVNRVLDARLTVRAGRRAERNA